MLVNNVGISKTVVSNSVFFGKKGFKYFLGTKIVKKLHLYAYYFQK